MLNLWMIAAVMAVVAAIVFQILRKAAAQRTEASIRPVSEEWLMHARVRTEERL